MGIGAVVVNYNTAALTSRAVASLAGQPGVTTVVVVDCASDPADREALSAIATPAPARVAVLDAGRNAGFAGGCNLGIAALLAEPGIDAVLLLNSDARLVDGAAARLAAALDPARRVELAGGRVVRDDGVTLDSMGIAMYASLLASNRMAARDRYFGPTGACAIYGRGLLEHLVKAHGHLFDEGFFCYAEDTDLAARGLLLGYEPAYVETVVALHEGQASSGGGFNDFVLYHGIRNSIWMAVKCTPWPLLVLCAPLVLALHAAIAVRHAVRGKAGVVARLYRDAWRGLSVALSQRRAIQRARAVSWHRYACRVTPRFYERDYVRRALGDLLRGPRGGKR